LIKSAYSQADLLRKRVSIDEALLDPALSAESKVKLNLAKQARIFAEQNLGLKPTQNYTSFVQLDRPFVTYVVSAAPKQALEAYLWHYPFLGGLPYKGFFSSHDAQSEANSLKADGLDVYIRGVSAYSTLGWFRDPILSSMLDYRDHELVNTIIHETVHATIYIKSAADFNEQLASFIGDKGAELYFLHKEGPNSQALAAIHADSYDQKLFSDFISKEIQDLDLWYNSKKGYELNEVEREKRLADIQDKFRTNVQPLFRNRNSYSKFTKTKLNNAQLLTYKLYLNDMSDFEAVFNRLDKNFFRMLTFCKSLESAPDPKAALAQAAQIAAKQH
jgi:predicted aminopeptidase